MFQREVRVPRKIRQLIADLERAGFRKVTQTGSHRKYEKEIEGKKITARVSGNEGKDAHFYQETEVKIALKKARGE